MKSSLMVSVAAGVLLAGAAVPDAYAIDFFGNRVSMDVYFQDAWQSLDADKNAFNPEDRKTSSGFQRNEFALDVTVRASDAVSLFIELAEEPSDFGTDFSIKNDLSFLDVSLLKLAGSSLAEKNSVVFEIGAPVVGLFNYRGYTDGAVSQGNPLIGNSPFDMVSAETGAKLIGQHDVSSWLPVKSFGWDVMLGVPTFGSNFARGRPYDILGKLRFDLGNGLQVGVGGYKEVHFGPNQFFKRAETNGFTVLDNGQIAVDKSLLATPGWIFGDGDDNYVFAEGEGSRVTHAGIVPGINARAVHADLQYDPTFTPTKTTLRAWIGWLDDNFRFVDQSGSQIPGQPATLIARGDSTELGWVIEGSVYVVPDRLYLASRFGQVKNLSEGIPGSPDLNRIQVGAGVWLHKSTLLKFEYVNQSEERNSPGQIGDDWNGVTSEISFHF